MKTLFESLMIAMLAAILVGCAHVPSGVTVGYYPAKSNVNFKIVRTVACDELKNAVVGTTVTATPTHSADIAAPQLKLPLDNFRGPFSDNDIKIEFYEDGRLKGVNATSTGQGETIIKAITTVATVAAGVAKATSDKEGSDTVAKECEYIVQTVKKQAAADPKKAAAGADSVPSLTITYIGDFDMSENPVTIKPEPGSLLYADKLKLILGDVKAKVIGKEQPRRPVSCEPSEEECDKKRGLQAHQPGIVKIKVFATQPAGAENPGLWEGSLLFAQAGTDYVIPIPSAASFGKQTFAVSFGESGAITSLQYVSTNGTGQALNATNTVLSALKGESAAQKASDLKAEGDVIMYQRRLVQCKASPSTCK